MTSLVPELFAAVNQAAKPAATDRIQPEHILLALAQAPSRRAHQVLTQAGATTTRIKAQLEALEADQLPATTHARDHITKHLGPEAWTNTDLPYQPDGKWIMNMAGYLAGQHDPDGTHIFETALLTLATADPTTRSILTSCGANPDSIANQLLTELPTSITALARQRLPQPGSHNPHAPS